MNDKLKPNYSGFFIPVAIILGAALIILGITKMLGSQSGYKRLVSDLNSKTFGNRWVAAYELSKYISTNSIPKEDTPWLIENLETVYEESIEPRTRNFVVLAIASLKSDDAINFLSKALKDKDDKVQFNAIVGLANLDSVDKLNYDALVDILKSKDEGIRQAICFLISSHKKYEYIPQIRELLKDPSVSVQITAATALLSLNNFSGKDTIEALFNQEKMFNSFDANKKNSLYLNVFQAVENMTKKVPGVKSFFKDLMAKNIDSGISTKVKQALLKLESL